MAVGGLKLEEEQPAHLQERRECGVRRVHPLEHKTASLGDTFCAKLPEQDKKMSLDWSQCAAVESVPGKVSGAWVLRGTRMPVSVIFENLEAGANIDDLMEWFEGLDREQIKAVIEFAARSLDAAPSASRR